MAKAGHKENCPCFMGIDPKNLFLGLDILISELTEKAKKRIFCLIRKKRVKISTPWKKPKSPGKI